MQATQSARQTEGLDIAQRFWAKVDRSGGKQACWPWTRYRTPQGYGQFYVNRERGRVPAHAFAVELETGVQRPRGQDTRHYHCDNPPCCNPRHLLYGSRLQNVWDAVNRGRHAHGERMGTTTLTEADVLDIRTRFAEGESSTALAAEYGITQSTLSSMVNGKTWAHVGGQVGTHGRVGGRPHLLTEDDVLSIRVRFDAGETSARLAVEYRVSDALVRAITKGRRWAHVGGPIQTGDQRGRHGTRRGA